MVRNIQLGVFLFEISRGFFVQHLFQVFVLHVERRAHKSQRPRLSEPKAILKVNLAFAVSLWPELKSTQQQQQTLSLQLEPERSTSVGSQSKACSLLCGSCTLKSG